MRRSLGVWLAALAAFPAASDEAIGTDELRAHVEALASVEMGGRLTGSPGERAAGDYVAGQFRAAGLLPAGSDGFFDPFDFASGVSIEDGNRLDLRIGDDARSPGLEGGWQPLGFSRPTEVAPAPIVFAGYGLDAPEVSGYDSYASLAVAGRWALVWRGVPRDAPVATRAALSQHAELRFKTAIAAAHGAVGIMIAPAPGVDYGSELPLDRFEAGLGQADIPAIAIDGATAAWLLASLGPDLDSLARRLIRGEAARGALLPDAMAGATIALSLTHATGRNVVARLGVGDPSLPPLVVGAHLDHLGQGETGTSLATGDEVGLVNRGADDNASGVASLIEIAESMAVMRDAGRLRAARDVVFAAWSGEEIGLLGSRHFVEAPGRQRAAAYINMDMVGRLREKVTVAGTASSDAWPEFVSAAERADVAIERASSPFVPTDAMSFYMAGVPVLSVSTGVHSEYHTPRDLPMTLNYQGMARIAGFIDRIARALADTPSALAYLSVPAPAAQGGRRRANVTLGTIPDYGGGDAEGVPIAGTVEGGPAALAGLVRGDRIVGLGGARFSDIYGFVLVLNQLRGGEPVDIIFLRDGARLTRRIIPAARPDR